MLAPNYDVFNHYDGNLGIGWEDPISNPNRLDWQAIINQGFAVGSQAINAFSGQNGGVQVGYNQGAGGVFAIHPQVQQSVNSGYDPYAGMTAAQRAELIRRQASGGGFAEDAAGGVMDFISKYPLPIAGGVLALYLLMKEPPRRR